MRNEMLTEMSKLIEYQDKMINLLKLRVSDLEETKSLLLRQCELTEKMLELEKQRIPQPSLN
jgi:hypothetical protein